MLKDPVAAGSRLPLTLLPGEGIRAPKHSHKHWMNHGFTLPGAARRLGVDTNYRLELALNKDNEGHGVLFF